MPQQQRVFITKHGREHNRKRLRFPNCRDRNLDQMLLCLTRFFFPSAIATITWLFCYSVLFVWHSVGMYYGNEVTRISLGNVRPQSSQLAEPLWTDAGLKSEISVRELISTLKNNNNNNKKPHRLGMNCRTFSQNPRTR